MNLAVLGDSGRFPLSLVCLERSLKYWLKIKHINDIAMQDVLTDHCATFMGNNKSWGNLIKQKLDSLGFSNLWENQNLNLNMFPSIQRRVRDIYIQEWHTAINNSPKLKSYVMFKENFEFEPYLDYIHNNNLRMHLTRFRISSHSLAIESGRFNNIDRNNRLCIFCNQNSVESEYHFLLVCQKYNNIRSKFIKHHPWPTMNRFKNLLSSKNRNVQLSIAKYIKNATEERQKSFEM